MTLEPLQGKDVECNPCSNTQRSTDERRLPSQARSSSYQRANLNSDMEKILFFALCSIEDCLEAISDKKRHLSISDMKDSSHLMLASTTEDNVSTSIVSIEDSSTLTPSSGNTDSVSHSSRELRHMDDIWESLQMCASESPLVVCLLVAAGKYNVPKEERLFPGGIEEQLTLFPILSSGARVAEGLA